MKNTAYNKTIIFCFLAIAIFTSCVFAACKNDNDDRLEFYARAKVAFDEGKFTQVIQLLESDNTFVPSLGLCGKAYYFTGDKQNAEKKLSRAIKLRQESVDAKIYLTRVYRESGRTKEAENLVKTILQDDPQNIRAVRLASDISREKGGDGAAERLTYIARG
jgi:tetratricopeptide (TPR) repeat protein